MLGHSSLSFVFQGLHSKPIEHEHLPVLDCIPHLRYIVFLHTPVICCILFVVEAVCQRLEAAWKEFLQDSSRPSSWQEYGQYHEFVDSIALASYIVLCCTVITTSPILNYHNINCNGMR